MWSRESRSLAKGRIQVPPPCGTQRCLASPGSSSTKRRRKGQGLHPPVRCREGCDVEKSYDSRPSKKLGLQLNFQWIPFRRTVEHLLLLRLGVTTREGPEVGCRWGTEMLPTTRTNPLWANTKQPCRVKHLLKWPLSQNCRPSQHGREGRLAEGHPYNLEHRHGAHDRV